MKRLSLLVVPSLIAFGVALEAEKASGACDFEPSMSALHDVLYVPNNLDVPNWFVNNVNGLYVKDCHGKHEVDLPPGVDLASVGVWGNKANYTSVALQGTFTHPPDPTEYTRYEITPDFSHTGGDVVGNYHRQNMTFGPIFLRSDDPDGTRSRIYYRLISDGFETLPFQSVEVVVKRFPEPGPPSTVINSPILWMFMEGAKSWPGFDIDMAGFFDSYQALGFNSVTTHEVNDFPDLGTPLQAWLGEARSRGMLTMNVHSPFGPAYVDEPATSSTSTEPGHEPLSDDACPAYHHEPEHPLYDAVIDGIADRLTETLGADYDQSDLENFKLGALRGLCPYLDLGQLPDDHDCKNSGTPWQWDGEQCERCRQWIDGYLADPVNQGKTASDAMLVLGTEIQADINAELADRPPYTKPRLGAYNTRPDPNHVYSSIFSFQELVKPVEEGGAGLEDSVPVTYGVGDAFIGDLVRQNRAEPNGETMQLWLSPGFMKLDGSRQQEFRLARIYDDTIEGFGGGAKGLLWFGYITFEASDFYHFAKAMESITPVSGLLDVAAVENVSTDREPEILASALVSGTAHLVVLRSYATSWVAQPVNVTFPGAVQGEIWDLAGKRRLGTASGEATVELFFEPGAEGARTRAFYIGDPPYYPGAPPPHLALSPSSWAVRADQAGATLVYALAVTNNDAAGSGASSFQLALTVPQDWSGSVSPAVLALEPGETGDATVSVTSPAGAPVGIYPFSVDVTEAQHSPSWVTGGYEVADLDSGLVAHWTFEALDQYGKIPDEAPEGGQADDATPIGDASLEPGRPDGGDAVRLHGTDDLVALLDSPDINEAKVLKRTVSFWFQVVDKNRLDGGEQPTAQMIFDEGFGLRGLNIYVYDGSLYVGGWNTPGSPESDWDGTFLSSSDIESGTWHHVALVLDATDLPYASNTRSLDTFRAYLDGALIGTGEGSQVWEHQGTPPWQGPENSTVGAWRKGTRFHTGEHPADQTATAHNHFQGMLDEGRIYNRALSPAEIALLADATVQLASDSIAAEDGWVRQKKEGSPVGGQSNAESETDFALKVGDDQKDQQYKSLVSFDTSALPDGAEIAAATLELTRGGTLGDPFGGSLGICSVDIKEGAFGEDPALENSDYEAVPSQAGIAQITDPGGSGDGYAIDLGSGVESINDAGRTQLRFSFAEPDDDDGLRDLAGFYSGEDEIHKPQLIIDWRPGP